ncbi:MAG: prenyltransferase [Euryarchaeota archaeon]|nr:prenyltransferase [Euryarchaeota archaeon]
MAEAKTWFEETRPQFLLLSVVLVIYGTSIAVFQGYFNALHFVLALVGLTLMHISTNVLNDYFDYKSGIDLRTQRTPFSGGSGILPAGRLRPESVYRFGLASLALGLAIGAYFVFLARYPVAGNQMQLAGIIVIGAVAVYFYNTHLSKLMLGEVFAGLGLGTLPVMGAYFVQTGFFSLEALIAAIPPGILTHHLLLLNEFPDAEADRIGGRRHMVILLGKKRAGQVYAVLLLFMYLWIIGAVGAGYMPVFALLALLTLPMARTAVRGALYDYDDPQKFIPAQGANVMVNLLTQILLAAGFLIGFLAA